MGKMMRQLLLALTIATFAATPTLARPKLVPLPEATAASLAGKTLAVTRRGEKPSFMAMTAGKATFALLGAGAMAVEGNRIVRENGIADPADTVEAVLVPALGRQYGVKLMPESGHSIAPGNDLKQIIGAAPGVDLILDIRSTGWNFAYYPTHWGTYWVGYGVEVQLVDAKSGTVLADAACGSDTRKNAAPPSKDALLGNGAQLLKDTLSSLSWMCTRLLASDGFHIVPANVPETPSALTDPLTAYAAKQSGQGQTAGAQPVATPPAPSPPAPAPTPDAPATGSAEEPAAAPATPTNH
jgi:hypothetical protein